MSKELTPWFPPEVKPARKGYYISSVSDKSIWYRYWDGENWYHGLDTLEGAVREYTLYTEVWSRGTPLTWRGLAKKP